MKITRDQIISIQKATQSDKVNFKNLGLTERIVAEKAMAAFRTNAEKPEEFSTLLTIDVNKLIAKIDGTKQPSAISRFFKLFFKIFGGKSSTDLSSIALSDFFKETREAIKNHPDYQKNLAELEKNEKLALKSDYQGFMGLASTYEELGQEEIAKKYGLKGIAHLENLALENPRPTPYQAGWSNTKKTLERVKALLILKNMSLDEGYKKIVDNAKHKDNDKVAFSIVDALAKKENDPDALLILATFYWDGTGVESNQSEALKLFKTAADAGHPEACFALSNKYLKNILGHDAEGINYLKKAADAGHLEACFELGKIYRRGGDYGIEKNEAQGLLYIKKAASGGFERAQEMLKEINQQ